MNKPFSSGFSIVSDALNGIAVFSRRLRVFSTFGAGQHSTKGKAIFALCIVCFFWGTTWVASKEGVRYMPPLQLAGIRQSIGGFIYLLYFLYKKAPLPKGREWWPVLILSFLNFMLSNTLSTWGVRYVSAGLGSIIGSIFPLWLVVISIFGSGSTVNKKTALGLTLGFTGICVIFYQYLKDFLEPDFRLGIFLLLASTWSWAAGTLYTKTQAARFNAYFSLGLQMVIAGPVIYFISVATNNAVAFTQIPWQSWAAIGYLVLFGSVIAFAAYLYALQNLPTEQASLYAYINPVVALVTGALFFGEKLTWVIVAGVLITLYGVRQVNRGAKEVEAPEQTR
ncbi:MAG TPA: EamA family transporter [Flavisolibacter sp.]|jgi:drug/metabolite transporter (DMT)-like permease|nr:EamA family transporter [Flavisolibacter sp.]